MGAKTIVDDSDQSKLPRFTADCSRIALPGMVVVELVVVVVVVVLQVTSMKSPLPQKRHSTFFPSAKQPSIPKKQKGSQ